MQEKPERTDTATQAPLRNLPTEKANDAHAQQPIPDSGSDVGYCEFIAADFLVHPATQPHGRLPQDTPPRPPADE
jgi:hypothetical protein